VCDSDHIVTAIKPSKRARGRYSVYIDGKSAVVLTSEELAEFRLKAGRKLSRLEFECLSDQFEKRRVRQAAFRLLSYRSRSEKELSDALRRKGFSHSKVRDLLFEFREKGLISDRRYAVDWVENRLRLKPRGSKLLVAELLAKGIPEDMARDIVRERFAGIDEAELAFELIDNRKERFAGENSVDTKRKICNFLRYRGFGADDILFAAGKFLRQVDVEAAE
jgi:regulatory protein